MSKVPRSEKEASSFITSPCRLHKPAKLSAGWPLQKSPSRQPPSEQDRSFDPSLQIGPVVQAKGHAQDLWPQHRQENEKGNGRRRRHHTSHTKYSDFQSVESAQSMVNINGALCQDYLAETSEVLPNAFDKEFRLQSCATGVPSFEQKFLTYGGIDSVGDNIDQTYLPNLDFEPFRYDLSTHSAPPTNQIELVSFRANSQLQTTFPPNPDPDPESTSHGAIPSFFFRSSSDRLSQQASLSRPLQIGDEVHITDHQGNDSTGQVTYQVTQIDPTKGLYTIVPLPRALLAPPNKLVRAPIPNLGFASVFQPEVQLRNGKQEVDFEEIDFGVAKRRWVVNGERRCAVESWTCAGTVHEGIGDEEIAAEWV